MSFDVRLQRDPVLATPEELRDDLNLQKVAVAVRDAYMKKEVPTTAEAVKAQIERSFPAVTLSSGVVYHQYTNPITGDSYWCCRLTNTLRVTPPGEDPVLVELMETKLVP